MKLIRHRVFWDRLDFVTDGNQAYVFIGFM